VELSNPDISGAEDIKDICDIPEAKPRTGCKSAVFTSYIQTLLQSTETMNPDGLGLESDIQPP
jgi:hypothetical protein